MKKYNVPYLLYLLNVASIIILVICILSRLDESFSARVYFNSDTLYLPSIYKDLIIDHHPLKGWVFNPAPNFFPDMLLYFILMFCTNNLVLSFFLFSVIQVTAILLLIKALFKIIFPEMNYNVLVVANLFMSLFLLVSTLANDFFFSFFLLSNSYHTGAFVMGLVCLLITFNYFKRKSVKQLYLLLVLGFLAVVSDRLFLVIYSVPVLTAVFFAFRGDFRKQIFPLLAVNVFFSILGLYCFGWIKSSNYVFIDEPHRMLNFSDMKSSFHTLMEQMGAYLSEGSLKGVIVLLSMLSFVIMFFIAVKSIRQFYKLERPDFFHLAVAFYSMFILAYSVVVFFAPVVNGNYTGWDTLRYNIYVLYVLLFSYAFYLLLVVKRRSWNTVVRFVSYPAAVTLMLYLFFLNTQRPVLTGFNNFLNYYPAPVRCMDSLAQKHELRYGVSNYWLAKLTTLFSKQDLRVYAVFEDIVPNYHVTNINLYYGFSRGKFRVPNFNFIILNDFSDKSLYKKYLGNANDSIKACEVEIVKTKNFEFDPSTIKPVLVAH